MRDRFIKTLKVAFGVRCNVSQSFEELESWIEGSKVWCKKGASLGVCANKCDKKNRVIQLMRAMRAKNMDLNTLKLAQKMDRI